MRQHACVSELPPPPGSYRASDGRDYPIPRGQYLASDGRLYPLPTAPPSFPAPGWRWTPASGLIVGGSLGVVIGAFLPWATVGPFSKAGTDGDGVITLILGLACAAFGVAALSRARRGYAVTALVAAVLAVVVAIIDIGDVSSVAEGPLGIEAEVGVGLVLTLVAGLVAVAGCVVAIRSTRRPE